MKKTKKHIGKSLHKHYTKKSKAWFVRYRFAIVGVLSLAVILLGSINYFKTTSVLGLATFNRNAKSSASTPHKSCYNYVHQNQCSGNQLCTVSGNTCSRNTKAANCHTVLGKCGVPSVCRYNTYTQCGQTNTHLGSSCPAFGSNYSVTMKKPLESGCPTSCTGSLTGGQCGISQDFGPSSYDVALRINSFACTVKGQQYVVTVKGSVKLPSYTDKESFIKTIEMFLEIRKEVPFNLNEYPAVTLNLQGTQYINTFTRTIYIDKSHLANTRIISASLSDYTGPESDWSGKEYLDLSKCH